MTGSAARPGIFDQRASRPDLQRYRAPSVEEQTWAPDYEDDVAEPYRHDVRFMGAAESRDYWGRQQNDMAQGPYGGYNHAGTPALWQVRRVSR